jgi:hypothetical protein
LGYWNRRPPTSPLDGHYRLAINAWDTAIQMRRGCPDDRFKALGIVLKPPQSGGKEVLIAAMSVKAAKIHGYDLNQWEDEITARIKRFGMKYPITLRGKPSKKKRATETIEAALSRARILVTRHSNAAVDALVNGVPFYAEHGVAASLSVKNLTCETLTDPVFCTDQERNQLLCDIAYAQWSPPEMRTGKAWEHIRSLICA